MLQYKGEKGVKIIYWRNPKHFHDTRTPAGKRCVEKWTVKSIRQVQMIKNKGNQIWTKNIEFDFII